MPGEEFYDSGSSSPKGKIAMLMIEDEDNNLHDFAEWVSELKITHEDIDSEKSGRDVDTGEMKRKRIAQKHTLEVKMVNRLPQTKAREVFKCIYGTHIAERKRYFFNAWYQSPCADEPAEKTFYCSKINFGAQRYDRNTNQCYYDGMTFNLIQK